MEYPYFSISILISIYFHFSNNFFQSNGICAFRLFIEFGGILNNESSEEKVSRTFNEKYINNNDMTKIMFIKYSTQCETIQTCCKSHA